MSRLVAIDIDSRGNRWRRYDDGTLAPHRRTGGPRRNTTVDADRFGNTQTDAARGTVHGRYSARNRWRD